MKKERLLFILYDRPNYPGGPIINYLRLLPALAERGYEVHVLVMYHSDYPNARMLQNGNIYVYVTPFIVDGVRAVRWILEKIEKIQPDVFIPDVSTPGCFAGKWAKDSGIPVINSHRSDDDNNWGKAMYFSDPQYGFASSAIFCVSNYLLSQLEQKVKNPALLKTVIPSGVPISPYYSRQKDPVSIVYVGRLIQRQKRILDTINVFFELAGKFKDITFTFIGDGPDRKICEGMIVRSMYASRFKFMGMLKGDRYKSEIARQDVVVLLSEYEGVPGSLMDAMAGGLVPVCYRYPGAEELVIDGETGLLVTDRNEAVIETVSKLVNDAEWRKQLSRNARRHIIKNFSLESAVDKWENLINTLADRYAGCKKMFIAPNTIELPPMNKLLKEHVIEREPSVFFRLCGRVSTGIKGFLMEAVKGRSMIPADNFIHIPFVWWNLDKYVIRTAIKRALDDALPALRGRLLDAGCGKMPYKKYILNRSAVQDYVGLDIETALVYDENVKPDYTWDGRVMPFENESFDNGIAIEVLEHCPEPEVFLKEVYRVLKPGSAFFFAVPFLWNLHEVPHDEYRYTPFALERHLRNAGFADIEIKAMGGWHASLAQMLGLWVRRAPMRTGARSFLSFLFMPVIGWLIKKDTAHPVYFSESQMITGLYGLAKKHAA